MTVNPREQVEQMEKALLERNRKLSPEQRARRELVDKRNKAIQENGLKQPASGVWGTAKP